MEQVPLDDNFAVMSSAPEEVVALDKALKALEMLDARKGRVVEMKLFGGMSGDEIAEALGVTRETVQRDWKFSKSWLQQHLGAQKKFAS